MFSIVIIVQDICKKIHDWEKRIYLLRTVIVYQQCYLLEDDDEIWETHAALAETLQLFADDGGTSIWVYLLVCQVYYVLRCMDYTIFKLAVWNHIMGKGGT